MKKKGRPPLAGKRALFFKLVDEQGLTAGAAAREVGVEESTGRAWRANRMRQRAGAPQPTRIRVRANGETISDTAIPTTPPAADANGATAPGDDLYSRAVAAARLDTGGSSSSSGAPPPPNPDEITPEIVLDIADGAIAFGANAAAFLAGCDTTDPRVAPLMKMTARERSMLAPFAPAVARRMPDLLRKLDRLAPYAFGGMLLMSAFAHATAINAVAKMQKAARKAAADAAAKKATEGSAATPPTGAMS
jgi:hypothetical protein